MIFRFLTSLKLTLTLMLGLAFVSIFGTVQKVQDNRFDVFYQAAWFRLILLLLALNIAACTWKTIQRNLKDRSRFLERLATDKNTTGDADQRVNTDLTPYKNNAEREYGRQYGRIQ